MGERAIWVRPLSVHPIPDSPDHGVGAQRVVDMLSTYLSGFDDYTLRIVRADTERG